MRSFKKIVYDFIFKNSKSNQFIESYVIKSMVAIGIEQKTNYRFDIILLLT